LLPHLALGSHLYVSTASLPAALGEVAGLLEVLGGFLADQPLVRASVYLLHPAPHSEAAEIRSAYQALARIIRPFNREGYLHQEVPRLLLLPIIEAAAEDAPALAGLTSFLRGLFATPSLYLSPGPATQVPAGAEKVFWGGAGWEEAPLRLADYALLDDSLERLESGAESLAAGCGPSLIVSAAGGAVYGCQRAYRRGRPQSNISQGGDVGPLLAGLAAGPAGQVCLRCRAEVARSFLGSPEARSEAQRLAALLYTLGCLNLERGDYPAAAAGLEGALGLAGGEERDHVSFRLGLACLNLGRWTAALKNLSAAAATYGGQYYFHFYLGLCHVETGEPEAALTDFTRALGLGAEAEDRARILGHQGACLNGLGDYRRAAAVLEEAKALAGATKEVCNGLGFSYFKLRDYDQAIANLREAVRIDPTSAIDYASLGSNLREKGELGEAIQMYEKALELDPGLEFARANLAELRKRSG
jgi:tetratricopeptide (TPR) repeat protein